MRISRSACAVGVLLVLAACVSFPKMELQDTGESGAHQGYLFRASETIENNWLHIQLKQKTDYQLAIFDNDVAILAEGRHSASGLARRVSVDITVCPEIEWAWNVAEIQDSANLYERDLEDVAASIFLVFGDPGLMSDPDPVPTIRYVWTTDHVEPGTVIDNPYLKGTVRSIVVRVGEVGSHEWVVEKRNLLEDFTAAYGYPPEDNIQAIILFSDNDQTKEPVIAYYGWARVHCLVDGISVEDEPGWD